MHVLAYDAQARQLPQEVRDLLHDTCAAVLHREHRDVDRSHGQRLEGQPEGGEADSFGAFEQHRDGLIRVRARFPLIGDLHPKMRCRRVSATWLVSWSWSVTGGWPLVSWPLVSMPFGSCAPAILRRSSSVTSFLVSATLRQRWQASSALCPASVIPIRPSRWWKAWRPDRAGSTIRAPVRP